MKKLLFIMAMAVGILASTTSYAQQEVAPARGTFRLGTFTKSDTSVNVVNTTAESDTFVFNEKQAMSNLIITATYKKVGGTVTNGSAKLYGSTTGAYWEPIVTTADTMSITNTNPSYSSGKQGYSWEFGPSTVKYRRYKVVYQLYGTCVGRFETKVEYY